MFKKGDVLILSVIDDGNGVTDHYNNTVVQYADGLLKVKDGNGQPVVYNMHSRNFVKARKQDD